MVDAACPVPQAEKLVEVLIAPLVGEVLGVERARIELANDGLRHSVRIGDAIDDVRVLLGRLTR